MHSIGLLQKRMNMLIGYMKNLQKIIWGTKSVKDILDKKAILV